MRLTTSPLPAEGNFSTQQTNDLQSSSMYEDVVLVVLYCVARNITITDTHKHAIADVATTSIVAA